MLEARQANVFCDPDGFCREQVYLSPADIAIRFAVVFGVFFLIFGYFAGGYMHAKRRQKKNKPLLRYHRWMITPQRPQNPVSLYAATARRQAPNYNSETDPNSFYGNFNAPPAYSGDLPPGYTAEKDVEAGNITVVPEQPAPAKGNGRLQKLQFWRK